MKNRIVNKFLDKIVVCFLSSIIILLFASFTNWQTLHGKVVGISDGDTITLLVDGNTQYKIRLLDIDCPEKNQAFGQAAKKHLSDLIFAKMVDVKWQKLDRNKRVLGTVICNNININQQMIVDGYAWHFVKYSKDASLHELEIKARNQKRGLWQDNNPMAPWDFRKSRKESNQ
jgi:micrococcal nuclease